MFHNLLPALSIMSVLKGEVCYDRLGCFTDKAPWSGTLQRPLSLLPWSPEDINTRFLLYTRQSPNNFQEIGGIKPNSIAASQFKVHRETRFIIHGFTDNGEKKWLSDMCKAMLRVEDVNCICVDWSGGSLTLYSQAANNIRVVGAEVAYFIQILENKFGYSPTNVHIIGHSLGAHAAGEAGKRCPGIRRITGLDPAQPYFQDTPTEVRLDPSDAQIVDVIHTDSSSTVSNFGMAGYGIRQKVGHLDFFPNGGEQMPGCEKDKVITNGNIDDVMAVAEELASCHHMRSIHYYTESIASADGFIGFRSNSYQDFLAGAGFPCPSTGCPLMGHYAESYAGVTATGQTLYLHTGDRGNFSRWRYRVTVRVGHALEVMAYLKLSLHGSKGSSRDYRIYRGLIKPGTSYTTFIDSETDVGHLNNVTFVWRSPLPKIHPLRLGASTVTVQYGKDGSVYSFCDNMTVTSRTRQTLRACAPPSPQ